MVDDFVKNVSTCTGMEELLRMISLPLVSWAVTILRTGGSIVWNCDMIFLDKVEGVDRAVGSKNERLERQIQLTYILAWRNLGVNPRNRPVNMGSDRKSITHGDMVKWHGKTRRPQGACVGPRCITRIIHIQRREPQQKQQSELRRSVCTNFSSDIRCGRGRSDVQ